LKTIINSYFKVGILTTMDDWPHSVFRQERRPVRRSRRARARTQYPFERAQRNIAYETRFRENPYLQERIPGLSEEDRRQIGRFFANGGHGELSRENTIIVQQLLAAATGARADYRAYTDGIIGPLTRRLLARAMRGDLFERLQSELRKLEGQGDLAIDNIPGNHTLSALSTFLTDETVAPRPEVNPDAATQQRLNDAIAALRMRGDPTNVEVSDVDGQITLGGVRLANTMASTLSAENSFPTIIRKLVEGLPVTTTPEALLAKLGEIPGLSLTGQGRTSFMTAVRTLQDMVQGRTTNLTTAQLVLYGLGMAMNPSANAEDRGFNPDNAHNAIQTALQTYNTRQQALAEATRLLTQENGKLPPNAPGNITVQGTSVTINGLTIRTDTATGQTAELAKPGGLESYLRQQLGQLSPIIPSRVLAALKSAGFQFNAAQERDFLEAAGTVHRTVQGNPAPDRPLIPENYALHLARHGLHAVMGGDPFNAHAGIQAAIQAETAQLTAAERQQRQQAALIAQQRASLQEDLAQRVAYLGTGAAPSTIAAQPGNDNKVKIGNVVVSAARAVELARQGGFAEILGRISIPQGTTVTGAFLAAALRTQGIEIAGDLERHFNREVDKLIAEARTLNVGVNPQQLILQGLSHADLMGGNPLNHAGIRTALQTQAVARLTTAMELGKRGAPTPVTAQREPDGKVTVALGEVKLEEATARAITSRTTLQIQIASAVENMSPQATAEALRTALVGKGINLTGVGITAFDRAVEELRSTVQGPGGHDIRPNAFQLASYGLAAALGGNPTAPQIPASIRQAFTDLTTAEAQVKAQADAAAQTQAEARAKAAADALAQRQREAEQRRLEMARRRQEAMTFVAALDAGNAPSTIQAEGDRVKVGDITLSSAQATALSGRDGFIALQGRITRSLPVGITVASETAAEELAKALEKDQAFNFGTNRQAFLEAVSALQRRVAGIEPPVSLDFGHLLRAGLQAPNVMGGNPDLLLTQTRLREAIDQIRTRATREEALRQQIARVGTGNAPSSIQPQPGSDNKVKIGNVVVSADRANDLVRAGGFADIARGITIPTDVPNPGAAIAAALRTRGIEISSAQEETFNTEVNALIRSSREFDIPLTSQQVLLHGLGHRDLMGGNISHADFPQALAHARLAAFETTQAASIPTPRHFSPSDTDPRRGRIVRVGSISMSETLARSLENQGYLQEEIERVMREDPPLAANATAQALRERLQRIRGLQFFSPTAFDQAVEHIRQLQGGPDVAHGLSINRVAALALGEVMGGSGQNLEAALRTLRTRTAADDEAAARLAQEEARVTAERLRITARRQLTTELDALRAEDAKVPEARVTTATPPATGSVVRIGPLQGSLELSRVLAERLRGSPVLFQREIREATRGKGDLTSAEDLTRFADSIHAGLAGRGIHVTASPADFRTIVSGIWERIQGGANPPVGISATQMAMLSLNQVMGGSPHQVHTAITTALAQPPQTDAAAAERQQQLAAEEQAKRDEQKRKDEEHKRMAAEEDRRRRLALESQQALDREAQERARLAAQEQARKEEQDRLARLAAFNEEGARANAKQEARERLKTAENALQTRGLPPVQKEGDFIKIGSHVRLTRQQAERLIQQGGIELLLSRLTSTDPAQLARDLESSGLITAANRERFIAAVNTFTQPVQGSLQPPHTIPITGAQMARHGLAALMGGDPLAANLSSTIQTTLQAATAPPSRSGDTLEALLARISDPRIRMYANLLAVAHGTTSDEVLQIAILRGHQARGLRIDDQGRLVMRSPLGIDVPVVPGVRPEDAPVGAQGRTVTIPESMRPYMRGLPPDVINYFIGQERPAVEVVLATIGANMLAEQINAIRPGRLQAVVMEEAAHVAGGPVATVNARTPRAPLVISYHLNHDTRPHHDVGDPDESGALYFTHHTTGDAQSALIRTFATTAGAELRRLAPDRLSSVRSESYAHHPFTMLVEAAYVNVQSDLNRLFGTGPGSLRHTAQSFQTGLQNAAAEIQRLMRSPTITAQQRAVLAGLLPPSSQPAPRPTLSASLGAIELPLGGGTSVTVPPNQRFTLGARSRTVVFPPNLAPMTTYGHSRKVELTLSGNFDPNERADITIFFPGHGARIGPGGRHDIVGTGAGNPNQNVPGQFLASGVNGLHIAAEMGDSDPGRFRQPGYLAQFVRHSIEQAALREAPDDPVRRQAIIDRLSRSDTRINLVGYSGGVQTVAEILRQANLNPSGGMGSRIGAIHLADGLYSGGPLLAQTNAHVIRDFLTRHTGATLVSTYTTGNTAAYNIGGTIHRTVTGSNGRTRSIPVGQVSGLRALLADVPDQSRIHIGPVPPAPPGQLPHETLIQRSYEAIIRHAHGVSGAPPPLGPVRTASLQRPDLQSDAGAGARTAVVGPPHEVADDPRGAVTAPDPSTTYYNIITGQLHDSTGRVIIQARAGRGTHENNPASQYVRNQGPMPATLYRLLGPTDSAETVGWSYTLQPVDISHMRPRPPQRGSYRDDIAMHHQFYEGSQGCLVTRTRAELNVAFADMRRLNGGAGARYVRAFDPRRLPPELQGQPWAIATQRLPLSAALTEAIRVEAERLGEEPEGRWTRQSEDTVPPPLPELRADVQGPTRRLTSLYSGITPAPLGPTPTPTVTGTSGPVALLTPPPVTPPAAAPKPEEEKPKPVQTAAAPTLTAAT
jgi:hypothetical protein